jgi:hypothetical protein
MKKILASLFVTSVAICSASAANAQSVLVPAISIHTGTIPTSCRFNNPTLDGSIIATTQGTLIPNSTTAPTSLSSLTSPGSLTIICNSTHTFEAKLVTGASPTPVVEKFRFINTPAPYSAINSSFNSGAVNTSPVTVTGLTATDRTGYVVGVAAEASLANGSVLPPGTYTINIEARVTAN